MARPYFMNSGRISEGGVPSSYGWGKWKANQQQRLMFVRKMAERKKRQEWIDKTLGKHQLSPWQKSAGARHLI